MWDIIYYQKEDGTTPVQEFLDALPVKHHAKAIRDIDVLEKFGTTLTEPHVKHIKGKLWELRIKSSGDISRIFYFIPMGASIVLLHGFVKKTQKTPAKEIETASNYLEDYQRRHTT
ncbi:MAG: type II toxin-antitoxin system RelE/ParE family toxin [Oscillospiraceae bacterium]|jgi:phage-related protein|nr:type II toxin-antitoxin system RelE/ParE family toxin [Oscillospiraceae bacterium]